MFPIIPLWELPLDPAPRGALRKVQAFWMLGLLENNNARISQVRRPIDLAAHISKSHGYYSVCNIHVKYHVRLCD